LIADVEAGIAMPEEEDCPQACSESVEASRSNEKEHLENISDGLNES
jgi:hypothetical protein